MESVFSRFDSYDFQSNSRFQEGLEMLKKSSNNPEEDRVLDLKLFFYNRFVEPIDQSSYKQWRSSSPQETQVDSSNGQSEQRTRPHPDSDISENQIDDPSAETESAQLSFAEVMKLVQEGKEVPDVKKLDIKPTNQNPTPSQMDRRRKPWESSSDPD